MIEWKHIKSSAYGYYAECYYTSYREYTISIIFTKGCYILQWQRNGRIEAQKSFEAKNFDEAKSYAIGLVKDYIAEKAMYWRDVKIGFSNWIEEEI